jgi:ubiquitin C-terminal hydrolase
MGSSCCSASKVEESNTCSHPAIRVVRPSDPSKKEAEDCDRNATANNQVSPVTPDPKTILDEEKEDTANPQIQADYEPVNDREVRIAQGLYPFPEITQLPYKDLFLLPSLSQTNVNGLVNVGVSCYFNVVLQSLANTPGLKEYFLGRVNLKENQKAMDTIPASPTSPLGRSSRNMESLSGRMGEFVQLYHSYNDHVLNPYRLIELVRENSKIFNPQKNQDDAHEFILYFIDRLATELNRYPSFYKERILLT